MSIQNVAMAVVIVGLLLLTFVLEDRHHGRQNKATDVKTACVKNSGEIIDIFLGRSCKK